MPAEPIAEDPLPTALFAELVDRAATLNDLVGPQIEAWVSGLFPALVADSSSPSTSHVGAFVDYCKGLATPTAALLCRSIAELTDGVDDEVHNRAKEAPEGQPAMGPGAQIGQSVVHAAWQVTAPFGQSVLLGYHVPHTEVVEPEVTSELEHSVLVELDQQGGLVDLQLAGPAQEMVDEVVASDDRVEIVSLTLDAATERVIAGWTSASTDLGPGVAANQQFVRRRMLIATGVVLPELRIEAASTDVQRGLDDDEFARANAAALSTLRAALSPEVLAAGDDADPAAEHLGAVWSAVIRGDVQEVTARERDGLVWLEWADWLGAGIGVLRAPQDATIDGSALVDYVNRCPEVSSTIDRSDRDYAEWAFGVALDLIEDAGGIAGGALTPAARSALGPAMVRAWSDA